MPEKYRERLTQWLDIFGFTDDPFALYKADQEHNFLPFFFVDRPYLYDILGDPNRPQTAFLLTGRGDGKTAIREMVAYECEHGHFRRRALAVRYFDFGLLLDQVQGDLVKLSARHHIQVIIRATLKALAEDVPPTYFDLLEDMDRSLLASYTAAFADPISRLKLKRIIPDEAAQIEWEGLSPVETLQILAKLITCLGHSDGTHYEALYVLVDRVDETTAGPSAAVPMLKPLVNQGPLLEMTHVALKFFLPIEVGQQLQQAVTLRPDRLCIRHVTWDDTALRAMVEQRLKYYSRNNVEHLEDLCSSTAKKSVMKRLIQSCEGSPRTLLRLCGALLHHHIAHANGASIELEDLIGTLYEFGQQLEVERTPLLALASPPSEVVPWTPSQQGLYLDESGHVWIDGELLSPPLSDLEFRLLKELYRRNPKIVRTEALIDILWPTSDDSTQGMDEQNLRKLITRLRQRLPGPQSNFIRNARGQGYWLYLGGHTDATD